MDRQEIDRLFLLSLDGDYDDDQPWEAVHKLRSNGSREVFETAVEWCRSDDPMRRARGAGVLCQLRDPGTPLAPQPLFVEDALRVLLEMAAVETHPLPLQAALHGLGHLYDARALPALLRHIGHADETVRFAVAFGLGCYPHHSDAIQGLLALVRDEDSDVRDWAVFGLGVQGDADSPEIREALLRSLRDDCIDVREEALLGLAKRRDLRVLPALREALNAIDTHRNAPRVPEAAALLLDLPSEPPGWTVQDYMAAIDRRFPHVAPGAVEE